MASFPAIESLNIRCDLAHAHQPWGLAKDPEGKRVWATSLESEYPKKMCVAMVNVVLQFAEAHGLKLRAQSLEDAPRFPHGISLSHSSCLQVAEFTSVAVSLANAMSDTPCALMSNLDKDIQLYTEGGMLETVPKHSRFLRFSSVSARAEGVTEGQPLKKAKKAKGQPPEGDASAPSVTAGVVGSADAEGNQQFEVAFGLPWTCEGFISQACSSGHPAARDMGVPRDLETAVCRNVEWNDLQMSNYRIAWCRKWLARAHEFDALEKEDPMTRHPAVAELTAGKRLLLTKEMLEDVRYEDTAALKLLSHGATLAGEVEVSEAFDLQFKPCLITLQQLEADAVRRNEMILQMTGSSGSEETDLQMLEETEIELSKGWAEGPFELTDLEPGATISRRFPLVQPTKDEDD
eukprot:s4_g51.t1